MNHIDELVARLCPGGVEHRPLGEVGEFIRGSGLQKKDFVEEGVGCIHYGQIYTYYGTATATTRSFVTPELASRLKKARPGDLAVATTSENATDVAKAVAWLGAGEIAISGDAYVYRHRFDPMYAAYLFQSADFAREKRPYVNGTKVKRIAGRDLARIRVPVPPMEIQREVAMRISRLEVLNQDLERQMVEERAMRLVRTAEARDIALPRRPGEAMSASWRPLHELVDFFNGKPHERFVVEGGAVTLLTSRFISTSGRSARQTDTEHMLVPARQGDIAMVMSDLPNGRALASCYSVEVDGKYTANQRVCLLRTRDSGAISSRYLFHLLNRHPQLLRFDNGQYQTHLKKGQILGIMVPVPPVTEQRRLAALLDRLEAVTSGFVDGVAAEIAARRAQYEHYRDRLLTFPEAL
jgi:type I restriction enzyme S subunit